ncbi:ACP S-malonyltransferase [Streptomyces sp. 2314.4]|uniref:ACP S-malonyltransferase n=1 Tax=Streptomyces sp. 2314.4 TaxID=1881025 RepID=UPI00089B3426|nr:ACP S-malonyltransferase [Streptomyces sp. 2314.4]SEB73591.1 trans-AT polyketide synthase, acyltransferase and oxidoreductase domain-containing protein [Streptomyces sp. 2314.4]
MKAVVFPGQGAQRRGMGRELFDAYPELADEASEVLGYSLRTLCLDDPHRQLGRTEYTQPALFVVGALAHRQWRESTGDEPAFLAGHSLGEYCALHAAGAFDFATGLRLVQRRGALMAQARGGDMAAVVGVDAARLRELLDEGGFRGLTVANDNAPQQKVVSGDTATVDALVAYLEARDVRCVRLNVSGAFHSPLMQQAQQDFARFADGFALGDPATPVIANATARPYVPGRTARTLVDQIVQPVRWTESVHHLLDQGVTDFVELGGRVLGRLIDQIRSAPRPVARPDAPAARPETPAAALGSPLFRRRMGVRHAYAVGGMYRGIASAEMVVRLGRHRILGFLGTGGLPLPEIEQGVKEVQHGLADGQPYGVNVLADHDDPAAERALVDVLMRHGVPVIEASAFMQMTPALVLYRARGLRRGADGRTVCDHRIVAKVSRPEVAEQFMAPAPGTVLDRLRRENALTDEQAELARTVPMSHDITVEADSGGHTDGGVATVMMPAMLKLRQQAQDRYRYDEQICMGLAGGLGTPAAVAAAFMLGADYVLTGSINQCTVESGMSTEVKDMLQDVGIADTAYAPAGDMFEFGAKVQVLRKGVFFPTRANKLFSLYSHYAGLDDIPEKTRVLLERTYFGKSLEEVWDEVRTYLRSQGRDADIDRADAEPKQKMALVFRWYFFHTTRLAMNGDGSGKVNYQVQTGPALGAFNQWVEGTELASWRHRHVDRIALMLLDGAAEHIATACRHWRDTLGVPSA